ncbi:hypothetical protein TNCT_705551 [Trichonephila clavata]|uniref:Uncharacterized protein n=1 Tax=Trichonephila clavata TaxID=2740835 RepID=A0A8X6HWV1_TRICU|nr:hypothetical protein TNCT_513351 [Trichonephila clavata]GFQ66750.1 hypothetical protein TNCT_236181 [Trichonephila clavata]GFR01400.1 hypothetical protein TNCT_705551 [Trichonephila clavata]
MTGRCDGKPDHYEKNRRFRHLIPVLIGRSRSAKPEAYPATEAGPDLPLRREDGATRTHPQSRVADEGE